MSGGLYSMQAKDFDQTLDLTKVKPYGDTMNDGKVQLSFTLPVPEGPEAFTFFNCYGNLVHTVDYSNIYVPKVESTTMDMHECDEYVRENIGRKLVVVGASTGTDAHTVGIDAIMNMKGYAGHYGLERYDMFDAYNLGSQVPNEELLAKAIELKADAILVSQTVTQKDVHIHNLTNLIELMEAEGLRDKMIVVCGGPRISHELAKELGFDAGFGANTYADDVASYIAQEIVKRNKQ